MAEFDSRVLAHLSLVDRAVVRQCVEAIVCGPWIGADGEFETRLGVTREHARGVLDRWPLLQSEMDARTVHMSLNEACNGVRIGPAQWDEWFDCTKEEAREVFGRWKRR